MTCTIKITGIYERCSSNCARIKRIGRYSSRISVQIFPRAEKNIMTKFDKKELENSKRIFKSATPKYTIDWYIKWVASLFLLSSQSIRGMPELGQTDLVLSLVGVFGWLIVSVIWRDRALIMLHGIGFAFLLRNLIEVLIK